MEGTVVLVPVRAYGTTGGDYGVGTGYWVLGTAERNHRRHRLVSSELTWSNAQVHEIARLVVTANPTVCER